MKVAHSPSASLAEGDTAPFGTFAPRGLLASVIATTRSLPGLYPGKPLAQIIRKLGLRQIGDGYVDADFHGAHVRLHPRGNLSDKRMLFTPQFFDEQEFAFLRSRIGPGFTFVDAGANVGAYSLFVAKLAGPTARILAIEPQPGIFERLVANIRFNEFATIKAIACALADKTGELTMFLDGRDSGASSLKLVDAASGVARVATKTLFDVLREEGITAIDALKIDVEGAEDIVLQPFFAAAPTALYPRSIIMEHKIGRWAVDMMDLLAKAGYRQHQKTRLNLILVRD
jgi:FkbM family methyltransferase